MPKFLHTGEDLLSSLAVKEHLSLSAVDDSAVLWCHQTSIKYHMELSSKWRREARSVNNNSVVCHENILHLRFFICLLQLLTFVHQNHFAKIKVSILLWFDAFYHPPHVPKLPVVVVGTCDRRFICLLWIVFIFQHRVLRVIKRPAFTSCFFFIFFYEGIKKIVKAIFYPYRGGTLNTLTWSFEYLTGGPSVLVFGTLVWQWLQCYSVKNWIAKVKKKYIYMSLDLFWAKKSCRSCEVVLLSAWNRALALALATSN